MFIASILTTKSILVFFYIYLSIYFLLLPIESIPLLVYRCVYSIIIYIYIDFLFMNICVSINILL